MVLLGVSQIKEFMYKNIDIVTIVVIFAFVVITVFLVLGLVLNH